MLGVSRQFVDKLIASGRLAAECKPGTRHRVLRVADACSWRPPDVPAQTASDRRLTLLSTPAPSTDPTRHPLMLVFIDTNVWYPVVLADLVLRSVEIGLFDLAWTDESLIEVERVLVPVRGEGAVLGRCWGR